MLALLLDLRFTFRLWSRAPMLVVAAILSLALGIGANVMVFTWMRQTVLAPLPGVADAEGLVALDTQVAINHEGVSYPDFRDLRDENRVLSGAFAGQQVQVGLQDDGAIQRAWAWYGSWNLFDVLGVRPAAGRFFRPEDDRRGQPLSVVLSHAFWQERFGGDPSVLGRSLRLGGRPCTILGIAPAGFLGPVGGLSYDLFVPLEPFIQGGWDLEADLDGRDHRGFYVMGRLKPGVSFLEARQALRSFGGALEARHPVTNHGVRLNVYPLREAPMGAPALLAAPITLLFVGVAVLLLLATANVANLLLARAAYRERELALRAAVGAGRGRLLAQLLTESVLLGLAGGAGGVLLAAWGLKLFLLAIPTSHLPIRFGLGLDPSALAFALALALATSVLFGIVPALRSSAGTPAEALKEGSARGGTSPRVRLLQSVLAVLETALAVTLLAGAGLLVKSAYEIQRDSPGFEPRGVLYVNLGLDLGQARAAEAAREARELLEAVEAIPGVEAASFSEGLPLGFLGAKSVSGGLEGQDRDVDEHLSFNRLLVGPGFFRVFRIPLVSGREFTPDNRSGTEPVVIVNQTLAGRFWPGQAPVGRRLRINGTWRTIAGVCRDFKYTNWSEPPAPYVFLPFEQWDATSWNLVVRSSGPDLTAQLRRALTAAAPELPVQFNDMVRVARKAAFIVRGSAMAMAGLGLFALFLAAVGIYGIMAHAVSQRTAEIGVRMAMGATPGGILLMVLRQGLVVAGAGAALGLAGAYALGQAFAGVLHRTSPTEPLVFVAVPTLLMAVAAVACALPALRAARVNPNEALRNE